MFAIRVEVGNKSVSVGRGAVGIGVPVGRAEAGCVGIALRTVIEFSAAASMPGAIPVDSLFRSHATRQDSRQSNAVSVSPIQPLLRHRRVELHQFLYSGCELVLVSIKSIGACIGSWRASRIRISFRRFCARTKCNSARSVGDRNTNT